MMNMIRADIYAMTRGKGLYITFGLIFLLNILLINAQGSGTIGIHFSDGTLGVEAQELGFDGIMSVVLLYTNMSNMMFFLLPLIILASAPIFTHGTVKENPKNPRMPKRAGCFIRKMKLIF
jgi:ABC-2 type transport system permease protein